MAVLGRWGVIKVDVPQRHRPAADVKGGLL